MGTVLMAAPLVWTVLPVRWAATGAAPAAALVAGALAIAAIIGVATVRGRGLSRRSRAGWMPPRVTGPADRTGAERPAPPGPDRGPRWG